MKITDSKGLVVRVGGTVHVDGATATPFDPTPITTRLTNVENDVAAVINRTDDNDSRLNDLTDASPSIWDAATIYPQGSVVRHNGSTWFAKDPTTAGDEPTSTSVVWSSITLESLLARIVALETKPAP